MGPGQNPMLVFSRTGSNAFCFRFFEAIRVDDKEAVISLLNDHHFMQHIDNVDKLSLAFIQVVLMNNVGLLKIFQAHGFDIAQTEPLFQENGVMHAARYGHEEMLLYLLSAGVGVNHQSENGSTALHVAVENAQHSCLKLLVQQRGIDLNLQDVSGLSPLLWTAKLRDWKAMKILIDAGCNVHSTDYRNKVNALHVTVDGERAFWKGKVVTISDITKCIDLLIESGLDINTVDIHGNTPLVYAVSSDNIPAIKHLLKLNCDLEGSRKNAEANTCFHFPTIPNHSNITGQDTSLLPLYTALSKLQIRTSKILCAAGIKYHKLAWEPEIFLYLHRNRPLKKYFEEIVSSPLTLRQCCRVVIRQSLGQDIRKKCDLLTIPEQFKDFILLLDIDTM